MRLILEPTDAVEGEDFPQQRVVIEITGDRHGIYETGELLRCLLLGWGFQSANVDELIEPR